MAAHTLLFDLDGTLWDSFPWYAAFLSSGEEAAALATRLRKGVSIVKLHREYRMSKTAFRRHCAAGPHATLLYPDVTETLARLAARGTTLGVVTSLPSWIAEPMLTTTGVRAYFDTVIHAGSCRTRKPHPGPITTALGRIDKEAGPDIFYVGDREDDAQAAAGAGINFAWASYGYAYQEPSAYDVRLAAFPEVLHL